MRISNHQFFTEVFQQLQIKLEITKGHSPFATEAIKTSVLMWGLFMSSSMKAAMHLGPTFSENLEVYKNTNFEEIQNLFSVTQKLVLEHSEEILDVNTIDSTSPSWTRSTVTHDQVIQWTRAKVRVYSDSVLCLGMMSFHKEAITKWEGQEEEF